MAFFDTDERTPLLPRDDYKDDDLHDQFCRLVGVPPSDLPEGQKWKPSERSLYARAMRQKRTQNRTYAMTAATSNMLLLSQVVLGAAVTGLGATQTSFTVVTVLGALNTIIAGMVAYLKSRGQPMRARMFRDDLERVVDDIENSEVMWLGISKNVNGYDIIDTDDEVTVRSEVARLTRLYDKAVRNNTLNNPDMYGSGDGAGFMQAITKGKNLPSSTQAPVAEPGPSTAAPVPAAPAPSGDAATPAPAGPPQITPVAADPDESPATAKPTSPSAIKVVVPPEDKKDEDKKDDDKTEDDKKDDGDAKKDGKEDKKDGEAGGDAKPADANGETDAKDDSKPTDSPNGEDVDGEGAAENDAEDKGKGKLIDA